MKLFDAIHLHCRHIWHIFVCISAHFVRKEIFVGSTYFHSLLIPAFPKIFYRDCGGFMRIIGVDPCCTWFVGVDLLLPKAMYVELPWGLLMEQLTNSDDNTAMTDQSQSSSIHLKLRSINLHLLPVIIMKVHKWDMRHIIRLGEMSLNKSAQIQGNQLRAIVTQKRERSVHWNGVHTR